MSEAPSGQSLLVVGWSGVGKTVLAVQLMLRIRKNRGSLVFREPPADLSLIESAKEALSEGLSPDHTPSGAMGDLKLPLEGPVDLVWPDYGGEQVRQMVREKRKLPEGWRERIESAGGWLLLIRPHASRDFGDILSKPMGEVIASRQESVQNSSTANVPQSATADSQDGVSDEDIAGEMARSMGKDQDATEQPGTDTTTKWPDQVLLVEILQILREVRGVSSATPSKIPFLAVALTCWDELYPAEENGENTDGEPSPNTLLQERYPMLTSFIEANWPEDQRMTFGLSSQGRALDETPSPEYAERGPEDHGFVVLPNGDRDADLTKPIASIIERMRP